MDLPVLELSSVQLRCPLRSRTARCPLRSPTALRHAANADKGIHSYPSLVKTNDKEQSEQGDTELPETTSISSANPTPRNYVHRWPRQRREKAQNMQVCVPSPQVPGTQRQTKRRLPLMGRLPGNKGIAATVRHRATLFLHCKLPERHNLT